LLSLNEKKVPKRVDDKGGILAFIYTLEKQARQKKKKKKPEKKGSAPEQEDFLLSSLAFP